MQLEILYVPAADFDGSLAFYRSLGWTDLWREGETTAAVAAPGDGLQVLLDVDPEAPTGPLFVVDKVLDYHASRQDGIDVVAEPATMPGGYLARYREPGGSVFYVIDQSTAES